MFLIERIENEKKQDGARVAQVWNSVSMASVSISRLKRARWSQNRLCG